MNANEVLGLLAARRDDRGVEKWNERGFDASGLSSFGIGLTELRDLAKKIGRDRDLALSLWETHVYEARVISLLVDDPKAMTREQAEAQVDQVGVGMLSHVFSTCGASLAKAPFVVELADDWTRSGDPRRRACGYGLLYEVSKMNGRKAPDDAYFLEHVERIGDTIDAESSDIRLAMASALMGIGKRNAVLNRAALRVAKRVGPIEFESATGRCEPFDVVKHLTTDRLKEKLGV